MLQPVPNVQAVQWFDRSRSLTAGFLDGLQFRALSRNHHERLGLPLVLSIKLRTGSELIEGYAPFQTFKNRFGWETSTFREFPKRRNEFEYLCSQVELARTISSACWNSARRPFCISVPDASL